MNLIHEIVICILSVLLSINLFSLIILNKKKKYINIKSNKDFYFKSNKKIHRLKSELKSLKNPYGLNFKNYIFIKYIVSTIFFILITFRNSNLFTGILSFIVIFFLPNLLILLFKRKESLIVINELFKISDNILLSLSSNMTVYESLKICIKNIKYKRLKEYLEMFVLDYEIYNFNIEKAIGNIQDKFNCTEFNMFLDILVQGEKEGKLIENLEMFSQNLELSYFKTLKYKESKRMMYVIISCVIAVINIVIITLYPMVNEIVTGMTKIFM